MGWLLLLLCLWLSLLSTPLITRGTAPCLTMVHCWEGNLIPQGALPFQPTLVYDSLSFPPGVYLVWTPPQKKCFWDYRFSSRLLFLILLLFKLFQPPLTAAIKIIEGFSMFIITKMWFKCPRAAGCNSNVPSPSSPWSGWAERAFLLLTSVSMTSSVSVHVHVVGAGRWHHGGGERACTRHRTGPPSDRVHFEVWGLDFFIRRAILGVFFFLSF